MEEILRKGKFCLSPKKPEFRLTHRNRRVLDRICRILGIKSRIYKQEFRGKFYYLLRIRAIPDLRKVILFLERLPYFSRKEEFLEFRQVILKRYNEYRHEKATRIILTQEQKEEIADSYIRGLPIEYIATKHNISIAKVCRIAREFNIPRRKPRKL